MENRSLLVVDDNQELYEALKGILISSNSSQENQGPQPNINYELSFASPDDEALEKVVAALKAGRPYAVIYLGVGRSPSWKGIASIKKIWERAPYTEVVICAAYSNHSLNEIVGQLGVSDRYVFLNKPFDPTEVRQLTFALTAKWNQILFNRLYMENLESLVKEKTKEIEAGQARSIQSAKLAALGEMAAGIAHEINNPLAIIQSNVSFMKDILENDFDRTKFIKIADTIEHTTTRVAKIINGLKKFARSGDNDPLESVSLEQTITETLGICTEKFKVHDIALDFKKPLTPFIVEGRQTQLIQVFLNLLNNSYDAIQGTAKKWVKIEITEISGAAEIAFTDSGRGIPAEVQKKLFSPFFTTKGIGKGTGLGLSLSKGIIDEFHGSLFVDYNCPNTRFVVHLPLMRKT